MSNYSHVHAQYLFPSLIDIYHIIFVKESMKFSTLSFSRYILPNVLFITYRHWINTQPTPRSSPLIPLTHIYPPLSILQNVGNPNIITRVNNNMVMGATTEAIVGESLILPPRGVEYQTSLQNTTS